MAIANTTATTNITASPLAQLAAILQGGGVRNDVNGSPPAPQSVPPSLQVPASSGDQANPINTFLKTQVMNPILSAMNLGPSGTPASSQLAYGLNDLGYGNSAYDMLEASDAAPQSLANKAGFLSFLGL